MPSTLACSGTDVVFSWAALDRGMSLDPNTLAGMALSEFVTSDAGAELGLPPDGWRLASRQVASATFLAPAGDAWKYATLSEQGDGSWQFFEGGACKLVAWAPPAIAFAPWKLDSTNPPLRGSRELTVLAREDACANGKPPGKRLLLPVVVESSSTVTITILVRRLANADCQASPSVPVEVVLSSPLGDRTLLDGSRYPPPPRT